MRIGYLECFSGISGDMMLGALVDAGVPFELLAETAAALNVGARLEMRKVSRGSLAAIKVDVLTEEQGPSHPNEHGRDHGIAWTRNTVTIMATSIRTSSHEHHEHEHDHEHTSTRTSSMSTSARARHEHGHEHGHATHRSLSTILGIIEAAPLKDSVKRRATRAFQLLGEAEAAIHLIPIEKVHFHEVGAVDTIVDIVCSAAGCEALGVDRWMASPLNVGSGTVKCAHGTLPVPAPATLALLGDAPVYAAGAPMERVTPTGAAVLRMLDVSYGTLPAMRVEARGYGAGGRDTPGEPNLLRILIGEAADDVAGETQEAAKRTESIAVIETVIDDATPQLLAYVSELLLEAGAWDVYQGSCANEEGTLGRADDGTVQSHIAADAARSAAARDDDDRPALAAGKQDGARARVCGS